MGDSARSTEDQDIDSDEDRKGQDQEVSDGNKILLEIGQDATCYILQMN